MYDVVIVGAGIAGLGAARVLTRESYKVLVLEARSRPGGRIHTVQLPPVRVDDGLSYKKSFPHADGSTGFGYSANHDHLSVFHVGKGQQPDPNCDSHNQITVSASLESIKSSQFQPTYSDSPRFPFANTDKINLSLDASGPLDVDLGANYLIGCANRQTDQPLFHMARLLGVNTAACVGDLCKKYRGWECAELSVWRDHNQPGAPVIPLQKVAEAAFLFDKVIHLAVDKHLNLKKETALSTKRLAPESNDAYTMEEPSVKHLIDDALQSILQSEAHFGLRPAPTFRNEVEAGIFQSILMRYLAYVNPIDRLPRTVLDELCEVATPRWHLSMNGTALQSLGMQKLSVRKLTLSDRLALAYPSDEQREAYEVWAERKLRALISGEAGSRPSVARTVNVSWEDRLVTGRFSDLICPLIENVTIMYNAVVTDVDWSGANGCGVRVRASVRHGTTANNQSDPNREDNKTELMQEFYDAKYCIITVPVGVLKGLDPRSVIEFKPELPPEKRQAINRLGPPFLGAPTHDKVILRFRAPEDVFWDVQAAHLKCPDPRLHILNLHRYGKPGVLCCHIWGGSGLCPAGHSDEEVVGVIMSLLNRMYPTPSKDGQTKRRIPDPVFYLVTRWSEDPFALGAYTTGEPGSSDEDRLAYAASLTSADARRMCGSASSAADTYAPDVPRLLFAGEGTLTATEAKECTHGALQTGVLRALELFPFLKKSSMNGVLTEQKNLLPCIVNGPQLRSVILSKLAHYLAGKPLARWISNLCVTNSRTHRAVRATRSFKDFLAKGVKRKQVDKLDSSAKASNHWQQRHSGDPTLSYITASEPHRLQRSRAVALRPTERDRSVRTPALTQLPKRSRHEFGSSRKRKSGTTPIRSSHLTVDSQSEGNSAVFETRTVSVPWISLHPENPIPKPFSSILTELRQSWDTLNFEDREHALSQLSQLIDELRPSRVEMDNKESQLICLNPNDPCLVTQPNNSMTSFPH